MYEPTYLGEIELSEETLAHYGVKGMRWRHRKPKRRRTTPEEAARRSHSNLTSNGTDADHYYNWEYDTENDNWYRVMEMDQLRKDKREQERRKYEPDQLDSPTVFREKKAYRDWLYSTKAKTSKTRRERSHNVGRVPGERYVR